MDENGCMEKAIKQILNATWGNVKTYSGTLRDNRIRVKFKGRTAKMSTKVCVCMCSHVRSYERAF